MTSLASFCTATVDLYLGEDGALHVSWTKGLGHARRCVPLPQVRKLLTRMQDVRDAEQTHDAMRVQAARHAASSGLYDLLDGPERALARRINRASQKGAPLLVAVRALAEQHDALREHPATRMWWPLLSFADAEKHGRHRFSAVLQLGPRLSVAPTPLPHAGLRIVCMAFSPQDVEPVLDFEGEEERFLEVLAPFVQAGRALVRVVEGGTLEDLRSALLLESYDVVHLSGHGLMTPQGPRLVMEDEIGMRRRNLDGTPADVAPSVLIEVLRRAKSMPAIVMLSNCHSAESRYAMPSFAAELVAAGVPAVLGWTRPVRDDHATEVASDIYQQLAAGRPLPMAVELARDLLRRRETESRQPSHTWTTLALVTTGASGVRIDSQAPPLPAVSDTAATYHFLEQSRMRVLRRGFVGRRRPLQRLVRMLSDGMFTDREGAPPRAVAGLVVWGMKGVGKSCLVARAVERVRQHDPKLGMIVLQGALEDMAVLHAFQRLAIDHWGDVEAESILRSAKTPVLLRIRRVLARWRNRRIALILDDFEQNLEPQDDGPSRLRPYAAELLGALLPSCQLGRPKLLITTTAIFSLSGTDSDALGEIRLGPLEPAAVRKLWMRGPSSSAHIPVSLGQWEGLAARFGRNGRVLSWARDLLLRKTSEEFVAIAGRVAAAVPEWEPGDETCQTKQDELASLFLLHMAHKEARARVGPDVQLFLQRARVYEVSVPADAFSELIEGLKLDLVRDFVKLANLGLLEVGELDGQRAYRVSPLVEPSFRAERPAHWHSIASRYWWQAAQADEVSLSARFERSGYSWRHALAGRDAPLADRAGHDLRHALHESEFYVESLRWAEEHLAALPGSPFGALWAGEAENYAVGPTQRAHELLQTAFRGFVELHGTENHLEVAACLHALGGVLHAQGHLSAARAVLEQSLATQVAVHGTEKHLSVAACLHALGIVLGDQGDLLGARISLERSLALKAELLGSEQFPEVAASLHVLASVLSAQGDLPAARAALEHSLAIKGALFGSENHPDTGASLQALGGILLAQRELPAARAALERALAIEMEVHGTEKHLSVAVCLHELGDVLFTLGELPAAHATFARALAIKRELYETEKHASVATSLHALGCVLQAEGDLAAAHSHLSRALEIQTEVHGTEKHPFVATGLHALGSVLVEQGDLAAARAALERSLEIKSELYDDNHRSIAATLHVLGNILFHQKDLVRARAAWERSLSITEELHGSETHSDVSSTLHSLSMVCLVEGKLGEAVVLLRRALDIEVRCFGSLEQYHSAEIEAALAMVLLRLQQYDEARGRFLHAVPLLAAVNPRHPIVLQYAAWTGRR